MCIHLSSALSVRSAPGRAADLSASDPVPGDDAIIISIIIAIIIISVILISIMTSMNY